MKIMNIQPISNRIYIQPEVSESVLKLSTPQKKEKGKVLAVGPDVKEVQVGDYVIFTPWAVDVYEENGEKYYFVSEDPVVILAKI